MYIAYTDASIKDGKKAFLAFKIFFEDKRTICRRIVVNDVTDSNIAEALAVIELLTFVKYYNLKKGLILFDSNYVKSQLRKKGGNLPNNIKKTLQNLQIRTQVINRKYNVAHRICYKDKFFVSSAISDIERSCYSRVPDYPAYYLQPSVLEDYRSLYNKRYATFHEAQSKLNKQIWYADLIENSDGVKVYAIHDRRIKVHENTIVKISKVNFSDIGNHYRILRRRAMLKSLYI